MLEIISRAASSVFSLEPAVGDDYVWSNSVQTRRHMLAHSLVKRSGCVVVTSGMERRYQFRQMSWLGQSEVLAPYEHTILDLVFSTQGILALRGQAGSGKSSTFLQLASYVADHLTGRPTSGKLARPLMIVSLKSLRRDFEHLNVGERQVQEASFLRHLAMKLFYQLESNLLGDTGELRAERLMELFSGLTNPAAFSGSDNEPILAIRNAFLRQVAGQQIASAEFRSAVLGQTISESGKLEPGNTLRFVLRLCAFAAATLAGEIASARPSRFVVVLDDIDVICEPLQIALLQILNAEPLEWERFLTVVIPVRLATFRRLEESSTQVLAQSGANGTYVFNFEDFSAPSPHEIVYRRLSAFLLNPSTVDSYAQAGDVERQIVYRRFALMWYHMTLGHVDEAFDAVAGANLRIAMLVAQELAKNIGQLQSESDLVTPDTFAVRFRSVFLTRDVEAYARGLAGLWLDSAREIIERTPTISESEIQLCARKLVDQLRFASIERVVAFRKLSARFGFSLNEIAESHKRDRQSAGREYSLRLRSGGFSKAPSTLQFREFESAIGREIGNAVLVDGLSIPEQNVVALLLVWSSELLAMPAQDIIDERRGRHSKTMILVRESEGIFDFRGFEKSRFGAGRALLAQASGFGQGVFQLHRHVANVFLECGTTRPTLVALHLLMHAYTSGDGGVQLESLANDALACGFSKEQIVFALSHLVKLDTRLLWISPQDRFGCWDDVLQASKLMCHLSQAGLGYARYLVATPAYVFTALKDVSNRFRPRTTEADQDFLEIRSEFVIDELGKLMCAEMDLVNSSTPSGGNVRWQILGGLLSAHIIWRSANEWRDPLLTVANRTGDYRVSAELMRQKARWDTLVQEACNNCLSLGVPFDVVSRRCSSPYSG